MVKKEASQHVLVEAWMRNFLLTHRGCVIELKHAKGGTSIPYSVMEEHQEPSLRGAQDGVFVWKIDDVGYRKKPFDLIGVSDAYAFIAVRFARFIAIISIDVWQQEREKKERKSLTKDRARIISFDIIEV